MESRICYFHSLVAFLKGRQALSMDQICINHPIVLSGLSKIFIYMKILTDLKPQICIQSFLKLKLSRAAQLPANFWVGRWDTSYSWHRLQQKNQWPKWKSPFQLIQGPACNAQIHASADLVHSNCGIKGEEREERIWELTYWDRLLLLQYFS